MKRREFIKQILRSFAGLAILPVLPFIKLNKPKEWTFNVPKYNPETNISYINGRPVKAFLDSKVLSDEEIERLYKIHKVYYDLPPLCDFWDMPK